MPDAQVARLILGMVNSSMNLVNMLLLLEMAADWVTMMCS